MDLAGAIRCIVLDDCSDLADFYGRERDEKVAIVRQSFILCGSSQSDAAKWMLFEES